ncbi:MAG: histone deacetylase [Planctomycetes bacterium]|nr:histone deacetylase [Planctomycetota bacterium]
MVDVFHTDGFPLDLPPGHTFPQRKYAMLREAVAALPEAAHVRFVVPPAATDAELTLAHDPGYVAAVRAGTLDGAAQRRIGFPWSAAMVERSLRSCGATVAAARSALRDGIAIYLGGGTHHAFRAHGAGYCVFNDCAVAALALLRDAGVRRIAIVDLDVHQGDGTAALLAGVPGAFTFSMHGARNFPRVKERSDLDVELPDGCDDRTYLQTLDIALEHALERAAPEVVFYLAGADPLAADRLGRLALTPAGLAARDRRVLAACAERRCRVIVTMAGGYAEDIEATVRAQTETVRLALRASPSLAPS